MRNSIFFFIFIVSLSAFSQKAKLKAPNYKKIEKEINKPDSDYYYTKLINKFEQADSTMTLEEKRHLYYGFIYQDEYSPYGKSTFVDSLNTIFKKEKIADDDYLNIIKFSDSILKDNPFDLRILNHKVYCYAELLNDDDYFKTSVKMNIIIDAILSSGDGLSKKTAFYVTHISDEYDLISILGFQFGGSQRLIEHYDYLKIADNEKGIEGLYFDVTPCLNSLSNMFKE